MSQENRISLLKKIKLFENINDADLESIKNEFVQKEYQAGDLIIRMGDVGDSLYVILSGSARVYVQNKDGAEVVLARLEIGQFFGEQALLSRVPIRRNANVAALTHLVVLTLSHQVFQKCLKFNEDLRALIQSIGEKELITKAVKELQEQEDAQKELLSAFSNQRIYKTHEVLFRQGDSPEFAYYLLSGTVEIRIYDESSMVKSRSMISPGQFFGEFAILNDTTRAGMAVVHSEAKIVEIHKEKLKEICEKNPNLKKHFEAQKRLYQIPNVGLVTQFENYIEGVLAHNTQIKKGNGEVILATSLDKSDYFSVYYEGYQGEKDVFKNGEGKFREILIVDGELVGVSSIGSWPDLGKICQLVLNKIKISPELLDKYHTTGELDVQSKGSGLSGGIVCECMQVKEETIRDCIREGANTLEKIAQQTAASTVCGGCKPKIIEISGGNAWTTVKLIDIEEHNPIVRSFRFQPINASVSPYHPGQHVVIQAEINGLPIDRSYTLTSIPEDQSFYEITVKMEEKGMFSRWLFENGKEQTNLKISPPQGEYICLPKQQNQVVCFMAGIGITPAIAFIRSIIQTQSKRQIYLDYSVRTEDELIFTNQMNRWVEENKNVAIHKRITSKEGRLSENEIQNIVGEHSGADIYICGPKEFEMAILKVLTRTNISPSLIHKEEFVHAGGTNH